VSVLVSSSIELSLFRKPFCLFPFDLAIVLERRLDDAPEHRFGRRSIRATWTLIAAAVEHFQNDVDRRLRDGGHRTAAGFRVGNRWRTEVAGPIRRFSRRNELCALDPIRWTVELRCLSHPSFERSRAHATR
jgi:hypothetical protein